jgi:ABC-type transporter Mla MlaB component
LGQSSKLRRQAGSVVAETPPVDEARVMGMLRITIAETPTEQKWTVEGRLVHPWILELKSTWTRTKTARQERKCVVDLTGVTFIDKSGENVLAQLSKQGAELIATGCYTRHVVDNIARKKSGWSTAGRDRRRE